MSDITLWSKWRPHTYWPDAQAMGDCVVCGNTRQDCERFQAEHEAKMLARMDASGARPTAPPEAEEQT